jgi:hypothetical protein
MDIKMKIFNKTPSGLKAALTSIGLALAFTLTSAPVFAEKPDWAGGARCPSMFGITTSRMSCV